MRHFIWAVVVLVFSTAAHAGVTIKVNGKLSDADFYKAVSCGAQPGQACAEKTYRWSKGKAARLTVSLHFPDGLDAGTKNAFIAALSNGIQKINAAGSAVKISRVADGKRADIIINVVDPEAMSMLNGLSGGGDFVAHSMVSGSPLKKAQISVNQRLNGRSMQLVLMSNMLNALGFLNDVQGGPYTNSAFQAAAQPNAQTWLTNQYVIALRTHYPK
jgi:methylaspartate ammonia-lyase